MSLVVVAGGIVQGLCRRFDNRRCRRGDGGFAKWWGLRWLDWFEIQWNGRRRGGIVAVMTLCRNGFGSVMAGTGLRRTVMVAVPLA